jgi:hypothetical protein
MTFVDRRLPALVALLLFVGLTFVAIVLDGRLPASEESVAGWIAQVLGYLCALTAGVLLLAPPAEPTTRAPGFVVIGATLVLLLLDALTAGQDGGNIGGGLVRVVLLVVLAVVTARLATALAAARRPRP